MMWPTDPVVISAAVPLIRHWEGFWPKPYMCPAGKWTIGYGTTRYPDGRRVGPGDPGVTALQADGFLVASASRVLLELRPLLQRPPTINQAAAMLSLTYNIGVGCHDGVKGDFADSTLLAKFNAGDVQGAADQFLSWNKAHVNGKPTVLSGLTERRKAERELFLS